MPRPQAVNGPRWASACIRAVLVQSLRRELALATEHATDVVLGPCASVSQRAALSAFAILSVAAVENASSLALIRPSSSCCARRLGMVALACVALGSSASTWVQKRKSRLRSVGRARRVRAGRGRGEGGGGVQARRDSSGLVKGRERARASRGARARERRERAPSLPSAEPSQGKPHSA